MSTNNPSPEARFASYVTQLRVNAARIERELKKFADSLTSGDAAHAFSWGEGAFKNAAEQKVTNELLHWAEVAEQAEAGASLSVATFFDRLRAHYTTEVLRATLYPASSTSVPSNLMETYVASAKAKVLEDLRYF